MKYPFNTNAAWTNNGRGWGKLNELQSDVDGVRWSSHTENGLGQQLILWVGGPGLSWPQLGRFQI